MLVQTAFSAIGAGTERANEAGQGSQNEIQLTLDAICAGAPAPILFSELVKVSEASFAIAGRLP
jgi:hypothetical protein